jgi:hypothetical protein
MNVAGLILVLGGVFSICGAVLNWDWFMNHYKARLIVALLGRDGARVFYGLLGTVIVVTGLVLAFSGAR